MDFIPMLIIAALTFGACFLLDKGFQKKFRGKVQHVSGLSVRLNKRYASIGIIMFVLGVAALFAGLNGELLLLIGGVLIAAVGTGLVVYYMTFGVFYDEDTVLLTTFGKKSKAYRYSEIACQQLYNNYGQIVIELQMTDGRTVHLQGAMPGAYAFLDKAFARWCSQKNIREEDCDFHDPDNSCWFPSVEEN